MAKIKESKNLKGLRFCRYLRHGMRKHPPSERLKAKFDDIKTVHHWLVMLENEIVQLKKEGRIN